jgi:hypothetical protein
MQWVGEFCENKIASMKIQYKSTSHEQIFIEVTVQMLYIIQAVYRIILDMFVISYIYSFYIYSSGNTLLDQSTLV